MFRKDVKHGRDWANTHHGLPQGTVKR